jgi:hypothetical protein
MQLCDWSGKIAEVDYSTMVQDGIFIREKGEYTYWIKNQEFDIPIVFTGGLGWANSDTVYQVTIPAFDVHATVTAARLATIIGKATIHSGVLLGAKWRFGRRGKTCFIEFV